VGTAGGLVVLDQRVRRQDLLLDLPRRGRRAPCVAAGASLARTFWQRAAVAAIQKTASRWWPCSNSSRLAATEVDLAAGVMSLAGGERRLRDGRGGVERLGHRPQAARPPTR
jgi:hypothetical protein